MSFWSLSKEELDRLTQDHLAALPDMIDERDMKHIGSYFWEEKSIQSSRYRGTHIEAQREIDTLAKEWRNLMRKEIDTQRFNETPEIKQQIDEIRAEKRPIMESIRRKRACVKQNIKRLRQEIKQKEGNRQSVEIEKIELRKWEGVQKRTRDSSILSGV